MVRIASLVPAATETLYALGVEPVTVSHECDYPPAARSQPTVTSSQLPVDGGSEAINQAVAESGTGPRIDGVALAAADPDVVITQGMCSVCAVDDRATRRVLTDRGIEADLVVSHPHTFEETLEDIRRVADVVGRRDRGQRVIDTIEERLQRIRSRVDSAEPRGAVVLDWMAPPMLAGHWAPDLVELAGGSSPIVTAGEPSGPIEWATLRDHDPAVLLVGPCGYGLERTLEHREELIDRDGWASLRAVQEGDVYALDGNHLLNRPGPRLVGTVQTVASLLHPDRFDRPPDSLARRFPNQPKKETPGA